MNPEIEERVASALERIASELRRLNDRNDQVWSTTYAPGMVQVADIQRELDRIAGR